MIQKGKSLSLFQSDYIQLQSVVSSVTSWKYIVQEVPLEKKKPSREKEERKTRWKRGAEEKRDGKSLCERKGKRENKMWKKKKKRKKKKRKKKRENEMWKKKRKEERMKEREKETKGKEDKEE